MKRLLAAAALMLLTTAAHAGDYGCAVIDPNTDGWLAVRSGPGQRYPITRKLLSGRIVRLTNADQGQWWLIFADVRGQPVSGWVFAPLLTRIDDNNVC